MKSLWITCVAMILATTCSKSGQGGSAKDNGEPHDTDNSTEEDTNSESDTESDTESEVDTAPEGWGEVANVCWMATFGSIKPDTVSVMTRLEDGSAVVGGNHGMDAVFGEGEPNETVLVGDNTEGAFLARFAQDGALIWAKGVAVFSGDCGGSFDAMTRLSDGGFLTVGRFSGTAIFGPGQEKETLLVALENEMGADDLFLARYTEDGELVWARHDGNVKREQVTAVVELPEGSLATAGTFHEYTTLGYDDLTEQTITQYQDFTGYQQFIAQYESDGTLKWARAEGGKNTGLTMAHDESGAVITTGNFIDDAIFGFEQPEETIWDVLFSKGGFVSALDQDGYLEWVAGAAVTDMEQGVMFSSVAPYLDNKSIVAGSFRHGLSFDDDDNPIVLESEEDYDGELFVAQYTTEGQLIWARSTKSANGRFGHNDYGPRVESLQDGNFLLTGNLWGTALIGVDNTDGTGVECWLDTIYDGDDWGDEREPFAAWLSENGDVKRCVRVASNWENVRAVSTAAFTDGSFFVAGYFTGDVELLLNEELTTISSQTEFLIPQSDGFLMRVCPSME